MQKLMAQPTSLSGDDNRWDALRTCEAQVDAHIQSGNFTAALDTLVRGYDKAILGFCMRLLHGVYDTGRVEETVQDIFIDAYQAMPSFRRDASVTTWIFAIARNRCYRVLRDHYRRHRLSEMHREEITARTHTSPLRALEDGILAQEQNDLLRYSLTQLRRQRDRELLTMRYLQELRIVDMARFYGRPESTVRGWLAEALHQLQAEYVRCFTTQRSLRGGLRKDANE